MNVGKKRRLRRVFRDDGRTVIVPMDHGVTLGPVKGLEDMQVIVDKLELGGVDAVVVHKGVAKNTDLRGLGFIAHLSASTSLSPEPNWKVQVTSVLQAVRMGADGVSIHVNVGAEEENSMLADMGEIADECDGFGMPLLAMMYPRGPNIIDSLEASVVKHVARLGAELGADVVKTVYTGSVQSFGEVVGGCPVPVVIAGGPKAESTADVLRMVSESIQAGGVGVSIGRNVFQHERPAAMAKAVSMIVHEDASAEEALETLEGE